jgi:hypothetical protein
MSKFVLGYDPGGESGVAFGEVAARGISVICSTVDSVSSALHWFEVELNDQEPIAIGVDAFLFWSTVRSGWRPADIWLRERYPEIRQSILCTNSTSGSMAIQGMALALACRVPGRWPEAKLNEVHPKVLWHEVSGHMPYPRIWPSPEAASACGWLENHGMAFRSRRPSNEHEFDAALAVWITAKGIEAPLFDLVGFLESGSDSLIFPAGKVAYFWPTDLDSSRPVDR